MALCLASIMLAVGFFTAFLIDGSEIELYAAITFALAWIALRFLKRVTTTESLK